MVTGIGCALGLTIGLVTLAGIARALPQWMGLVGGAICGTMLGLAQWLFLRSEMKGILWWALTTAAGRASGLIVTSLAAMASGPALGLVIGGALGGLIGGLVQCLALHPEARQRRNWGWGRPLAGSQPLP